MEPRRGVPLADAAKRMGLSTIALRRRAERGTIEAYKENDRWYVVVLEGAVPVTGPVHTNSRSPVDDAAALAALREELAFLRGKVEAIPTLERELESRAREMQVMRRDHARAEEEWRVLLQNAQRLIPAIIPEAPQSPERPGDDESPLPAPNSAPAGIQRAEQAAEQTRRSWWQRLLGWE